jgi:tetratricopeptide (TPR) repeat protein
VFVDAVGVHLLVFALGQLAAWLYARSGRFGPGATSTVLLWVAVDWWLVARYLLAAEAPRQVAPLVLLYATAAVTSGALAWAWLRRRSGRAMRAERHQRAVACALAGDHQGAAAAYRELVWSDGWDAAAWLGLGDALRRAGSSKHARRSYKRAEAVDRERHFHDLLGHRRGLLEVQVAAPRAATAASPAVKGARRRAGAKARAAG